MQQFLPAISSPVSFSNNFTSHYEFGRASLWFQNYANSCVNITWEQFLMFISMKFEDLREVNVIEAFTQLKYLGNYDDCG